VWRQRGIVTLSHLGRAGYNPHDCGEKGILLAMRKIIFLLLALGLASNLEIAFAKEPGFKPEDLIAKHLAAIGSPEAIAGAKSRVAEGKIHFSLQSQTAAEDGRQTFASQGDKLHFYLGLPNPNYRGERFISDGFKISIADIKPGIRSSLGEFVHVQDRIIREGLWGGVLSTNWALLSLDQRHPKLTYAGLKKVDGRELHELRYSPAKRSDLQISLYFDQESFHHVMTVYSLTISPQIGMSDIATARQNDTTYRLEERFADFKTFDGLALPTQWEVRFTEDIPITADRPGPAGLFGRSSTKIWTMTEDAITNNVSLDPRNFAVK
jgi:hypothetical protein